MAKKSKKQKKTKTWPRRRRQRRSGRQASAHRAPLLPGHRRLPSAELSRRRTARVFRMLIDCGIHSRSAAARRSSTNRRRHQG